MNEEKKKKGIGGQLRTKYVFIIRKEENFEERLHLRITLSSLLSIIGGLIVLLIIAVISVVAFTPLREYIPGYYSDITSRKDLLNFNIKLDSLQEVLKEKNDYISDVRKVLSDSMIDDSATEVQNSKAGLIAKPDTAIARRLHAFEPPSHADSILRTEVESENPYNVSLTEATANQGESINNYFFFTPLKGIITNGFNPTGGHYGVDIVAKENEAIKATLDGTIILSTWTLATGNVIVIQHSNNLVSVYAHNSVLLKKQGDNVKAGDVIAIIGNTGELTTGPHLHFELWYEGNAVNPADYMSF